MLLDPLILLIGLQKGNGLVMVLAVDFVHILQLSPKCQECWPFGGRKGTCHSAALFLMEMPLNGQPVTIFPSHTAAKPEGWGSRQGVTQHLHMGTQQHISLPFYIPMAILILRDTLMYKALKGLGSGYPKDLPPLISICPNLSGPVSRGPGR